MKAKLSVVSKVKNLPNLYENITEKKLKSEND